MIKHTPKANGRFVLKDAAKKFACPSIELAKESFIARKKKQACIHRARADNADRAIELLKKGKPDMSFDPRDPHVPLIGQKPRLRVEHVPVQNLIMSDKDGDAELQPQEDITLAELYKLTLLLFWILGCPPIPQQDPRSPGNGVVKHLQWRQYIADEQLERHFTFRLRADQPTKGSA